MSVLELDRVTKRYDQVVAVNSVSFSVQPGRILGLLGPNGAGKTSTLRMIAHITAPDSGSITFGGIPVSTDTQEIMGYLPEERGLYRRMKIGEQLTYFGRLKGLSKKEAVAAARHWLSRFDAEDWWLKRTNQLSKGMQQKVQFVATVAHDPDLLIFDEPFSGLDPINSDLLRDVIFDLRKVGKTILFASHRMEQVEQICDDICLMSDGRAILAGRLRDVKRSFSRNILEIDFEGSCDFAAARDSLTGVEIISETPGHVRFRLSETGLASSILDHVRAASVTVLRFELVEPSLNEIFITAVKAAGADT